MNKALNKYVNDILAIAAEENMPWDVGINMFIANVRNHGKEGAPHYKGADHLDWGAVADELGEITPVSEADMINTFTADCRKHILEICELHKAGNCDGAVELMCRDEETADE